MDEDRFDFEKLKVYQKALEYVDFVYEMTKDFPKTELFALTDQFKRASISICLPGKCPASPALEGGVKGYNTKEKYLTGKPRPLGRRASILLKEVEGLK